MEANYNDSSHFCVIWLPRRNFAPALLSCNLCAKIIISDRSWSAAQSARCVVEAEEHDKPSNK